MPLIACYREGKAFCLITVINVVGVFNVVGTSVALHNQEACSVSWNQNCPICNLHCDDSVVTQDRLVKQENVLYGFVRRCTAIFK